ncbi:PREDICTED: U-box domain-containing protein 11-like [Fragaria vesca subsp. vesca]|uniref:U-box domain-containing protein 14-like isoform X1 n=1 Tax=Fragaria vesca subsp. vesca TaxID=101020 RepID=UPI0002C35178|nr:PREDICTED: U-box domain-containing protein 14-like isoform X1 [Fragaria vesca subsp. vesca]
MATAPLKPAPGSMSAVRIRAAIRAALSEAQSDSDEVQQKALQTLASITKVSPQNRNLLAQTEGAVPSLLALSESSSSITQNLALSILFNLSLNLDLKLSLADLETIYHLNTIISDPTESGKLASSLVCSLAMLDKNKAKFGVAGTIQLLVKAISGPRGPAAHHILSSLAELVRFHGNCTVAVREGAVPALLQVVESPDGEDLAGTSLLVLGLLARFDEGLSALSKTDQIVSSMVQVLKGRCMLSKEGAAELLLLLFDESEGCVRDALRLQDFSSLVADISVRGSARAREKAALLMKKMMDADMDSYADGNPMFSQW